MIQVTRGTIGIYGRSEGGQMMTKSKQDKPFCLEPEQEARFVKCGVARYASNAAESRMEPSNDGVTEVQEAADGAHLSLEYLNGLTNAALKKLAEDMGVDTSGMRVKADYVEALTAEEIVPDSDDAPPDLNVADPVEGTS